MGRLHRGLLVAALVTAVAVVVLRESSDGKAALAATTPHELAVAIVINRHAGLRADMEGDRLAIDLSMVPWQFTDGMAVSRFQSKVAALVQAEFRRFPEVRTVTVTGSLEMSDTTGYRTTAPALKLTFSRETYGTTDWSRARTSHLYLLADAAWLDARLSWE